MAQNRTKLAQAKRALQALEERFDRRLNTRRRPVIIINLSNYFFDGCVPDVLNTPIEKWVTVERALEEKKRQIEIDPGSEYELRILEKPDESIHRIPLPLFLSWLVGQDKKLDQIRQNCTTLNTHT